MLNVGVISLGCAKNLVDTERMTGMLAACGGYRFVQDPASADILIVNTCGFIESAKQESINTVLEMAAYKKSGRCRTLVMTGCLSERYGSELKELMPEVDILLGVHEYARLPALLAGSEQDARCARAPRLLATPPYRAYLRVGDGCNNRCAYCAIPLIRGPLVSEPIESLVGEAMRLADRGVTELTVIAQDTSGYGADLYGKPMLHTLLMRLGAIDALKWIRVLYTYPDTVTPGLIDLLSGHPKLVHYLDMPIQHVNDAVLRAMHRRGDSAHIRRIMDYVAEHAPDFILRTTVMLGFPGETDAAFDELLHFLHAYPFDRVGAFTFSPEDGTEAALLPGQLPETVKAARLEAVMRQQQPISHARNQTRIGFTTDVLLETVNGSSAHGRSYAEAPDADGQIIVKLKRAHRPGDYVPALLTGAKTYDLIGEEV